MAKEDNLVSLADRTTEEQREIARKGGIASGKARQEKATMKKTLEMLLEMKGKGNMTYREMATLGLLKGAVNGKADNYKVILTLLGEIEGNTFDTPSIEIRVVDNSNLEKAMYSDEKN